MKKFYVYTELDSGLIEINLRNSNAYPHKEKIGSPMRLLGWSTPYMTEFTYDDGYVPRQYARVLLGTDATGNPITV